MLIKFSLQIRWLNDYNSKIREYVGKELKDQGEVEAFYWMMRRTTHIPGGACRPSNQLFLVLSTLLLPIVLQVFT